MRVAISTPTGHIGRMVAERVLATGADVRLLARFPEKVLDLAVHGAEVTQGSLDDTDFVVAATRDVEALLWVTPASFQAEDFRGAQIRHAQNAAEAIRANGIERVVNISSLGAHLGWGCGPITGLHDVEQVLDRVVSSVTHLRPGYFYENFLWQLPAIAEAGAIRLPISGAVQLPMIATRDIAAIATERLLDGTWSGFLTRELHGPANLTFGQAAMLISEGIGQKVVHEKIAPHEFVEILHHQGFSIDAVETMLELYHAIETGLLRAEKVRSMNTSTDTSLTQFAREVIAPRLRATVAHRPKAGSV